MRLATILGTFQMILWLSLIYWVILPIFALPYKLLADPLLLGRSRASHWIDHAASDDVMATMRRQG